MVCWELLILKEIRLHLRRPCSFLALHLCQKAGVRF